MYGIILAGGLGTRLGSLTTVINKHLLPVYDSPMIFYPIRTLVSLGVTKLLIVVGGNSDSFIKLIGDGKQFGLSSAYYAYQDGEGGIADALKLGRNFVPEGSPFILCLGDNIFDDLNFDIQLALNNASSPIDSATIVLKEVSNPQRFGVATVGRNNIITEIEEKPENPKSNLAVTGLYIYPYEAFKVIETLKPSNRGELEITDLNNYFIKDYRIAWVKHEGTWLDCGTINSLYNSNTVMASKGRNKKDVKKFEKVMSIVNIS